MYSASNGNKLSQLPDLDAHRSTPREPLKRKHNKTQPQQRVRDDVSSSSSQKTGSTGDHDSVVNHTQKLPLDLMTLSMGGTNPTATATTIDSRKTRRGGRGKKPPCELLSDAQKKTNHIASEQKRRANIRIGFDQLTDIVPTLSHCHKSESLILQKSYDYIQLLLDNKTDLKDRIRELQMVLGDVPDEDSSEDDEEYIM